MRWVILATVLSGCISHSLLQRADTLEPGEHRLGGAVVAGAIYDEYSTQPTVNVEAAYRAGLAHGVDLGVVVFPLGLRIGPKFQLFEDDQLAISLEAGASFAYVTVPASTIVAGGGFASLFVGWSIDDSQIVIAATLAPMYAGPIVGDVASGDGLLLDAGLTIGFDLALADIFHLMPEVGLMFRTVDERIGVVQGDPLIFHAGIGGFFQWAG